MNPDNRNPRSLPLAALAIVVGMIAPRPAPGQGSIYLGVPAYGVSVNPVTNMVYSSDTDDNTVIAFYGATNAFVQIPVAPFPATPKVDTATNKAYVCNTISSEVTVIDGATNTVVAIVPTGLNPSDVAFNLKTGMAYVTNSGSGTVTVIDTGTNHVVATVTVGGHPGAMAINDVTNKVYVLVDGSNFVAVVDGAANAVVATVPTGANPNGVAVNPAINKLYVTCDWVVTIIDTTSNAVISTVTVGVTFNNATDYSVALDPAVNPWTNEFYVTNGLSTFLINGATNAVDSSFYSSGVLAIDPVTHVLYANTFPGPLVTAFDGNTDAIIGQIPIGAYGSVALNTATNTFYLPDPNEKTMGVAGGYMVPASIALGALSQPFNGQPRSVSATTTPPGLATTIYYNADTATPTAVGTYAVVATVNDPHYSGLVYGTLTITPGVPPAIVTQPAAEAVNAGASTTFWVEASGTPSFTYQWSLAGTPIPGATSGYLTIANAQAANAGSYSVTVTNAVGSATSSPAALTINSSSSGSPPSLAQQPASQTVTDGTTVVFTALAAGSGSGTSVDPSGHTALVRARGATRSADAAAPTTYQWFWNGSAISGATASIYVLTDATESNAGAYSCLLGNSAGSVMSNPANLGFTQTSDPGRLINISCRAQVGAGADQLIAGFVVGGQGTSGAEPLLIRASGPALLPFGVTGALADPELTLNSSSSVLATNDGWGGNAEVVATAASVGAFAWTVATSHDSGLVKSLPGGAYTTQIAGASGDAGVALAEIYDATPAGTYTASSPRLINISARLQVGNGGNILIAGFVIGGSTSKTVLVRASGPALKPFGVSGVLPDPKLQLNNSSAVIATNTGWAGDTQIATAASSVGAFSWGATPTPDSAILATLPPGSYTAQVSGASGDTGVALVEVYEVP